MSKFVNSKSKTGLEVFLASGFINDNIYLGFKVQIAPPRWLGYILKHCLNILGNYNASTSL